MARGLYKMFVASIKNERRTMSSKSPLLDRIAVTVKEAAILIGTSDKQIRKALYARELPAARLGKAYSIGVADLRKWFDGKKRTL
jgi:excisionase family DNA binding protein